MVASAQNIFLVGLMGAGKSTIGKRLAESMGKKFIDSDHEIERRTGVSIPTIFDIEGEEGFRTRETAVIDELTQQRGIVLATGGGAILRPENRSFLSARGLVIYLNASVDQLHRRTRMDRNRPLLQTDDPRARLQSLFDERDVLYREVADLVTGTDERSVQQAIPELIHKIEQL
ncbi:MAG: shikimate kinase AroK [Gammaproteobacteria bacterium]|jgi:shikimate kinase|nr:shikimate kinase AroK [Gammaproteobacteria bacterium]MBT3488100.1 shikimate kinase AroK [Gammaproteobacteria bacterium]MBT3719556.1 shikimate kinase AroK [Gammaproteobacteria bacterium]MBT3844904.1 shikimate kinase AroK [Gammaproteobacteria bacterium]MBT3893891.1 shikimate kinase AroK [Gammaproteobacteria bacterium]